MIKKCKWNKDNIKNRGHYNAKNDVFTVIVRDIWFGIIIFPSIYNDQ